ncbi:hypothetical protein [Mesorhizobium sp. 1M-11]|uniref:hypothetical protein n=1 Tax=Mesorhizobium sp. 1M-11 TaxID=1529006 RepID=UPI001AEC24B6|nr:hypothetical protein [Mesorhizobium sp. 1M-11]
MMDLYPLIATLTIHVLAGVFWAGSTSAMANLGDASAARLFPFQMGSAAMTLATGAGMWWFQLGGSFGLHEQILLVGLVAAVLAAAVQILFVGRARGALAATSPESQSALVGSMTTGNRAAAGLLMLTVASMMIARFY